MRKIKAFDKVAESIKKVDLIDYGQNKIVLKNYTEEGFSDGYSYRNFDEVEILYHTGFADIYDNDLLKTENGSVFVVEFEKGSYQINRYKRFNPEFKDLIEYADLYDHWDELEKIGNALSNPELVPWEGGD
jgi:hypothetical protein